MRTVSEVYNALYLLAAGEEPGSQVAIRNATPAILSALRSGPIKDKLRLEFVSVARERDDPIASVESPTAAGHLCHLKPASARFAARDPLDGYVETMLYGVKRIPPLPLQQAELASRLPPAAGATLAAAHGVFGDDVFRRALFACGGGAVYTGVADEPAERAAGARDAAVVTDDRRLQQALERAGRRCFLVPAEQDPPSEESLADFNDCTVVITRSGHEPRRYLRKCMTFLEAFISLDPVVYVL